MAEELYFQNINDIKRIAGSRLDEILATNDVFCYSKNQQIPDFFGEKIQPDKLFFGYKYGDFRGLRPIAVDESGKFWIGKRFAKHNFVYDSYGSAMSNFLDFPSPEIKYGKIEDKDYELSAFIAGATITNSREQLSNTQGALVPRLLTVRINPKYRETLEFMSIDINCANFPVDKEGKWHQIDFEGVTFYSSNVAARLSRRKITCDSNNIIIAGQLSKLEQKIPSEIIDSFLEPAMKICPEDALKAKDGYLWNYSNIRKILDILHKYQTGELKDID